MENICIIVHVSVLLFAFFLFASMFEQGQLAQLSAQLSGNVQSTSFKETEKKTKCKKQEAKHTLPGFHSMGFLESKQPFLVFSTKSNI